jgi:hypothetical protein
MRQRLLGSFLAGACALALACGDSFSSATPGGGGDAGNVDAGVTADASSVDGNGGSDASLCTPKQCPDQHWACGTGDDGCGGTLDCGHCHVVNFTCQNHACTCSPKSCTQLGYQCGTAPDGCGGTLTCGTCPTLQTCGAGGDHKCGTGICTAKTCTSANADCGSISDGCGAQLDCGSCTAPKTCGGAGTPNQCGCTPKTCAQQGWQCGSGDDGCGGTLVCPACGGGGTCDANHQCQQCTPTIMCKGKGFNCGALVNDCGQVEKCGNAPSRDTSQDNNCSNSSGHPAFYTCGACIAVAPTHDPTPPIGGDAGSCGATGPTPPEPGWDCVPAPNIVSVGSSWCCAQ